MGWRTIQSGIAVSILGGALLLAAPLCLAQAGEEEPAEGPEVIVLPPQAPPEVTEGKRKRPKRVLDEVIVTSQKIEQSLEDVAASVSTVDGDFIRESGLIGFPDLENYAANTDIRLHPWGGQLRIRGFGTQSGNRGFEPSVATIVDGVFYGRTQFLNAFFYDLERVEVLRGPQGTLFGKNSSAGVINVVTRRPGAEPGGDLNLTIGSKGERALRPAYDLPVSDALRFRLSGSLTDSGGQLRNTLLQRPEFDAAQQTGKLRMLWNPGLDWEVDAAAFHSNFDMNNVIFQLSEATESMQQLVREFDPNAEFSARNLLNSANVPAESEVRLRGAQTSVSYAPPTLGAFRNPEITAIASWSEMNQIKRDIDADFSPIPFIRVSLIEPSPFQQSSLELRFSAEQDDLFGFGHGYNFIVGTHVFDSSLHATDMFVLEDLGAAGAFFAAANLESVPQPLPPELNNGVNGGFATISQLLELTGAGIGDDEQAEVRLDQSATSGALFGQVEFWMTEHWGAISGLRWGLERKQGDFSSETDGMFIQAISEVEPHQTPISRTENEFSPKLGLKYRSDGGLTAYGTWSIGYKSGGFNALPLNDRNLEFGPEDAESLELGVATRLLGGAMRVRAAAFYTEFDNLQLNTFRDGNFIILNAGEALSRGFEMDLHLLTPLPGMDLRASVGLADSFFLSYPNAPQRAGAESGLFNNFLFGNLPVSVCDTGATGPLDENSPSPACTEPTQDLGGERIPGSPRWSATLSPTYTHFFSGGRRAVTMAFDIAYRGSRFLDVDLDPNAFQKATTEFNARVIFGEVDQRWKLSFSARNLTDLAILDDVQDQPLAPGNFAAIRRDRGRFLSAQLSWEL